MSEKIEHNKLDWPDVQPQEVAIEGPYADFVLTGQVPATPERVSGNGVPECPDHKEVQHRDMEAPWCNTCGWNRGKPAVAAEQLGEPRG